MGVTIHYRGRLKPRESARNIYILAKIGSDKRKWAITPLSEGEDSLVFRKNPLRKEYSGFVSSFVITPHENCEPLIFSITRDGYFEERCKTQFAPLEVHVGVVELLESLQPRLAELVVEDEGHYWETRDTAKLEHNVLKCYEEIIKAKEEDPAYYGPVKESDGRITDLVK